MSRLFLSCRGAVLAALTCMALLANAASEDEEMNRLASARGCARCHALFPLKDAGTAIVPAGPAWADIAARYRGQAGAEDRLVAVVLRGSGIDDRHWAGKTSATKMPANLIAISEDDARLLIRWVLRQDRRRAP